LLESVYLGEEKSRRCFAAPGWCAIGFYLLICFAQHIKFEETQSGNHPGDPALFRICILTMGRDKRFKKKIIWEWFKI